MTPEAEFHTHSNRDMWEWICSPGFEIVGTPFPGVGDSYQVTNSAGYAITWTSSNANVVSINSSGEILSVNDGFATIYANGICDGAIFSASKNLMVGLPHFSVLNIESFEEYETGYYHLYPTTSDSRFSEFIEPGGYYTQWKTFRTNSHWVDRPYAEGYSVYVPVSMTVYMRVTNGIQSSDVCQVSLSSNLPQRPIVISLHGSLFYDDDTGESGYVELKSSSGQEFVYVINDSVYRHFSHTPSTKELYLSFVRDDWFQELLGSVRPRGEESYLIIPIRVEDSEGEVMETGNIIVVYDENFSAYEQ